MDGRCPVVGLGASAGGLASFEAFFEAMRPDSGAAFVLVQHLDPTRESLAAELVAKHTRMPVVQVERDTSPRPNHVYVIPPNRYLTIADRRLRLAVADAPRGARMPIDRFFRSLAADRGERAVGVVLSGTGTDGALGLKEIKAAGGITMVQTPETAEYDVMPRSAIATGGVDCVLAVEEMPAAVLRYLQHAYVNGDGAPAPEPAGAGDGLESILAIVRTRAGLDFGSYRKGTLLRRILRRMSLRHLTRIADYAAALRDDAAEAQALGREFLINVTSFFRDPAAWQALDEEVVAPLVAAKEPGQALRIWVPGCATGEEAYSIAILLGERLGEAGKSNDVQIFASDIDDAALKVGRAGSYPASIAADVSPDRLRRFFRSDGHAYHVSKELRNMVTFAHQDVLSDPPFSRLDLVSCRNLLIYLEPAAQERVLRLLHFALCEDGALFLGAAETIGDVKDLFELVSQKWRIYRRIGTPRPDKIVLPSDEGVRRGPAPPLVAPEDSRIRIASLARQLLLDRHAPACVVIDRRGEILHSAGRPEDYLSHPSRAPTHNVFTQACGTLRTQLRAAVERAVREGRLVSTGASRMRIGGRLRRVSVSVKPAATRQDEELFVVSFHDEKSSGRHRPGTRVRAVHDERPRVAQLETELEATRQKLHATILELETTNEELQASNEDVMSANEELQSTNEELHTSTEELHSINEELTVTNTQLQVKVGELQAANDDLDNLLSSTNVATVFLDSGFHVRRFTPRATKLFNLIPSDVGRPLSHVVPSFTDPDLLQDAAVVLETLVPLRREVQARDGHWHMREALPYRTRDDRIEGVVITLSDVAEHVVREARVRAAAVDETVHEALLVLDRSLTVVAANRAFCAIFQTSQEAVSKQSLFAIDGGVWEIPELRAAVERLLGGGTTVAELDLRHAFPRVGERMMLVRARLLQAGEDNSPLVLLAMDDITERKRQEEALRESEARTSAIFDAAADAIVTIDSGGIITSWNRAAERIFGYGEREVLGQKVTMLMPSPHREEHDGYLARYLETGVPHIIRQTGREVVGRRKDGTVFPLELAVSEFHDGKGPGFVGIMHDITQRKRFEEEERRHQAELTRVLRVSLVGELGAGLAHELSQPLAVVVNTLEACATTIRTGKIVPKETLGLVDQAIAESLRAATIVRNVRDLVRRQPPDVMHFDLRERIESAARLVAAQLKQHNIALRLALGDAPLPVCGSDVEIEQVILNLLQNAVDSIAQAGGQDPREISVSASASRAAGGETVEVAVCDTGAGVAESELPQLFEPFYTTKPAGIGMGLAICRSIVEAHGGSMWVAPGESRPGAMTIRLKIPLAAPADSSRPRARSRRT